MNIFSPTKGDETICRRCKDTFVYGGIEEHDDGMIICKKCRSELWAGKKW